MSNTKMHNLRIVGEASASGGIYNNVSVVGEGVVNGDLDCSELNVTGNFKVNGVLKAVSGKIVGETLFNGLSVSERLKILGTTEVQGNASVKEFKINGSANTLGSVSSDEIKLYGELKVKGNCTAEAFISKGVFQVDGMLNAGKVDIQLHFKCKAGEIGGETITIRRGNDFILKRIFRAIYLPFEFNGGNLTADSIEGDDIYLEYTSAKAVRGNNVRIGPGCEIELVEYKGTFEKSQDAAVKENKKV